MVKKLTTITKEIEETYCDACGALETRDRWVYTCDVCEKDVCAKCKKEIAFSNHTYLTLCEDCITKDFSEYTKVKQEIIGLEKQVNSKLDELDAILEKMKE